eukprot:358842-Chlamydomonas_euryale.AAC.5
MEWSQSGLHATIRAIRQEPSPSAEPAPAAPHIPTSTTAHAMKLRASPPLSPSRRATKPRRPPATPRRDCLPCHAATFARDHSRSGAGTAVAAAVVMRWASMRCHERTAQQHQQDQHQQQHEC